MKTIILPTSSNPLVGELPPNTRFTYDRCQWLVVEPGSRVSFNLEDSFTPVVDLSSGQVRAIHKGTVASNVEGLPEKPVTRFADIPNGLFVVDDRVYLKHDGRVLSLYRNAVGQLVTSDFFASQVVRTIKTLTIELE